MKMKEQPIRKNSISSKVTAKKFIDADGKKASTVGGTRRLHANCSKQAKLERVFGTTACSSSLSVDPQSGLIAYPAGSIVVVLNPRTLSQAHLISASKNQLTSLAFSPSGYYIVTGEFGAEPKVRIWELRHEGNTCGEQRAELAYHKLGISCVSFTKDSDHQVISVGNQHDKSVCVWNWRTQVKLAESRLTCQVNAMDVSESGRMFVTVGVRHVKFWYLEQNADNHQQSVLLQGRSAILADQRNNTFVDICCAPNNRTFSITISKLLVEFVDKKLVNIYELGGEVPFSLSLGTPNLLFMGFNNGAIRAMNLDRMEPELELNKPHRLHCDIAQRPNSPEHNEKLQKHPDVHSLVFHPGTNVLTALYSDRSIYHWHLQPSSSSSPSFTSSCKTNNLKLSSQLFHVGPVFDIETSTSHPRIFFTAGADETVRVWFLKNNSVNSAPPQQPSSTLANLESNSYSLELRKILYLSPGIDSLSEQPDKNFGGILSDTLDSTTGVRCIRLNADETHLSCGTRSGNICVYDLGNQQMTRLVELEAHDGEVLCLEYNIPSNAPNNIHLLASGSRDRLIHLFDANHHYTHLLTIDDHSSSVSAIKFNFTHPDSLKLITFGTDKLIVVRQLNFAADSASSKSLSSRRLSQIVSNHGPNCMAMTREGNVLTGCQDRQLRLFNEAGKLLKTMKGTVCEEGTITKFCLDPSESFAATICSDRFVYIMDLCSGECVAVLNGQSDCVTGISFSSDCKRLILVSYSGCVLVWRLAVKLTRRMHAKLAQIRHDTGDRSSTPDSLGNDDSNDEFGSLTSLNICQTAAEQLKPQTRLEDDELDSGIGGSGGGGRREANNRGEGGGAQTSNFELKRIVPSDAIIRRSSSNLRRPSIGEGGQENLTEVPLIIASPPPADINSMQLCPPSSTAAAAVQPHRPQGAPPSYHSVMSANNSLAVNNQHHQQTSPVSALGLPVNNTTGGSRSMSNLHSVQRMEISPPQRDSPVPTSGGRRRWNVPVNNGANTPKSAARNSYGAQQNTPISPSHHQLPFHAQPPPHASNANVHHHQNNSGSSFAQQHPQQAQQYQYAQQQNQMQRHHHQIRQPQPAGPGMSSSVSMNALRSPFINFVRGDGVTSNDDFRHFISNQMHDSPSPLPVDISPADNGWNRNSLSKRYFQHGQEGGNGQQQQQKSSTRPVITTTVWSPAAKPVIKHRSSNLFNSSACTISSGIDKIKAATASSSSTATTPTGELLGDHQGHNRTQQGRQFQPKTTKSTHSQDSSSPEPGHQKGRMAMSKLKQRRLSTAREDHCSSIDGATPFRSRSQSPTHLAIQSLAAYAQQATSSNDQPAKSPSSLHGLSSSPSSLSRSNRRLSSVNSTRLQEARERLKKSQENLTAMEQLDEAQSSGAAGTAQLPRSKSIGNLRLTLARNGPSPSARRSSGTAAALSDQQREMAKSVNDLAEDGSTMPPMGGSRLAQLSASRQRLAQSIRDMRRMSNSDLTEPDQYNNHQQPSSFQQPQNGQPTPPDSAHSRHSSAAVNNDSIMSSSYYSPSTKTGIVRRGVQKKIDRNSPRYGGANTEARVLSATNPAFGTSTNLAPLSWKTMGNGHDNTTPFRSVSSVAPASPRSNYLAQKLAHSQLGPNSTRSPSGRPPHQQDPTRSLSIELASAAHTLANTAQMTSSPGSKQMALHASECIQEMTRACDKLLGTRQLINNDPAINAEDRQHLLTGVNRAISVFRQRLDEAAENGATSPPEAPATGKERGE